MDFLFSSVQLHYAINHYHSSINSDGLKSVIICAEFLQACYTVIAMWVCWIVIELKTGEFKPEYAEQLNFYLSAVDGILKKDADNPSIGLLLCKSKNDLVAEYALKDMSKPIGVSEYKVTSNLPEDLSKQLPSIEDIQMRIKR